MEATYTISERDYARASQLFCKITPKVAIICAVAVVALALAAFFGPPVLRRPLIIGLVVGIPFGVFWQYVINPLWAKKHYRKYKGIQEQITIELKDEGVWFSSEDYSSIIKWEKIFKWRQNDSYLLIYPMPRMFYVIPKVIENSGFDLSPLIEALQAKVGKET